MSSTPFLAAYAKLNTRQKEAVDALEGPVMVVAGPGTGKTQILTLRIARILEKTDTPPDGILALTFTDAGVRAMRERLYSLIGAPAYRVKISTFHSFAQEVIAKYPESFPRIIGSRPALEYDILKILEKLIDTGSYELIRPFGDRYYYLPSIKSTISALKREAVHPEEYKQQVVERKQEVEDSPDLYHAKGAHKGKMKAEYAEELRRAERALEFADVYERYEAELQEAHRFDFDDSILEVVKALEEDETLRLMVQEQYLYVLADEHQDSNGAQNKLLELIVSFHENPNLFVVGDEKQAIFRFQGASLEHFFYFSKKFPGAKLVRLEENYRSTQTVLDAAHAILETDLSARAGHKEHPVEIWSAPDIVSELRAVAEEIKKIPEDETVAVMYRRNSDAEGIMELFDRVGIRYSVKSPQEVLKDPDISRFITLLKAVAHYPSDEWLARAMLLDFASRDELALYEAIRGAKEGRVKLLEYLRDDPFAKNLKKWARAANNDPLPDVVSRILRESGFLASFLSNARAGRSLAKLHALWDEISSFAEGNFDARLSDFMTYLEAVDTHGVRFERELTDPEAHVTLLTVHKSKGLEFDHVFMVGVTESAWSGRDRRGSFDLAPRKEKESGDTRASEDERRLFYVALTRAKKRVVLSYPTTDLRGKDILPAAFVGELEPALTFKKETPLFSAADFSEAIFGEKKGEYFLKSQARIASWFELQGLSATAINNYLDCPWKYFYRSLIRLPEAEDKYLLFGTAVHAGLKRLFDPLGQGEKPSLDLALSEFDRIVARQAYSKADREEILEKGYRAIKTYGAQYLENYPPLVLTEFSVRGVSFEGVPLSGSLDRIDLLGDGAVRVVDYKTGKAKSSAEIAKKGLRRQIIFYRVLLDLFENGKYAMKEGVLDFVEPDDKGRLKREVLVPTDEEVSELKKEIVRVAEEIRTLAFWDKRCDEKECEYCELRNEVEAAMTKRAE